MRKFRIVFKHGPESRTVNNDGPVPEITVHHPNIMHLATFPPNMEALDFVNANEATIQNALRQVIPNQAGVLPGYVEPILNMTMEGFRQVQEDGGRPNDQ